MREQTTLEINHPPNRLECAWDPTLDEEPKAEEEHVLTAADFVVDEFELYGCGD